MPAESSGPMKTQSDVHEFSTRPGLHFFLTICFLALAADVYAFASAYGCLSVGNDLYCTYDIDRLKELGEFSIPSQTSIILRSLLSVLLPNLVLWPIVLILCTPVFLLAEYISRRCRIRRDFVGVIFWITVWTLAVLSVPLFLEARALSYAGHMSWHGDVIFLLEAAGTGVACGMVFCLLAFRSRGAPVE
jgi:hypothetical protein